MNVGIAGLGHLGMFHLKLLNEIQEITVNGLYDINQSKTRELASTHQINACDTFEELLAHNQAICIVTPTPTHFELAQKAIKAGKHVFIEKPATDNLEDTRKLIKLAREAHVVVQVGHVERFNPAFIAANEYLKSPLFFEAHRLACYNVRGTDVSVVYDLMIHDIDLILSSVNSKVKRVMASGTPVVSKTADVVNARVEFENGCVANLTSNRIAMHNLRKLRVFQKEEYISIDLLNKTTTVSRIHIMAYSGQTQENSSENQQFEINQIHPVIQPVNAIKEELTCFYNSIKYGKPVIVSLHDAESALAVVEEIEEQLLNNSIKK